MKHDCRPDLPQRRRDRDSAHDMEFLLLRPKPILAMVASSALASFLGLGAAPLGRPRQRSKPSLRSARPAILRTEPHAGLKEPEGLNSSGKRSRKYCS